MGELLAPIKTELDGYHINASGCKKESENEQANWNEKLFLSKSLGRIKVTVDDKT